MEIKYNRKKDEIKKCAKAMFLSYGYKKTTMEDIANKLGLKKNTLYYYFKDKEELFNDVLKEDLGGMLADIKKSMVNCHTAEEKIYQHFEQSARAYIKRSQLYTLDIKILLEFMIVIGKSNNEYLMGFHKSLCDSLKEGIKNGEFIKHDYKSLARLLMEINISFEFKHLAEATSELTEGICANGCEAIKLNMNKTLKYIIQGIKTKP